MLELEQTVTLFEDSNKTAKQYISVDKNDQWIIVTHDGNALSMSINNWLKLVSLSSELTKSIKKNNLNK